MKRAARLLSLFWGAVLAAGCSSSRSPRGEELDAAAPVIIGSRDAAREGAGARETTGPRPKDGPEGDRADASIDRPADAKRGESDASEPDVNVPPHACSAGHTCTGTARCERTCFSALVYRCSCADGRFVCTGCIVADGGAPDMRGPATCAPDVTGGLRCDHPGAVCQLPGDPPRLCACGEVGSDRSWICQ